MNRQVVKLTETTLKVLSEHSAILLHILLTIHNLYLIITSHREASADDAEKNNEEQDAHPIESQLSGKSGRKPRQMAAATTTIIGSIEGDSVDSPIPGGCPDEVASFGGCTNLLYISISSASSSSSGYISSAASPTTISCLNGSLSSSSLSLSAGEGEAPATRTTKSDHNYYCGNETIPCPNKIRLKAGKRGRWWGRTRKGNTRRGGQKRLPLKLLHFRIRKNPACAFSTIPSSSSSSCKDFR